MAVNLQKGQRASLDSSMKMALIGLGWDPNKYDEGTILTSTLLPSSAVPTEKF